MVIVSLSAKSADNLENNAAKSAVKGEDKSSSKVPKKGK
jgi:hypothetical protein